MRPAIAVQNATPTALEVSYSGYKGVAESAKLNCNTSISAMLTPLPD